MRISPTVSLALKQTFLSTIKSKLYRLCLPLESQEHYFISFCPPHLPCIYGLTWLKISSFLLIYSQSRIEWQWQLLSIRKYVDTEIINDFEPGWLEQCYYRKRKRNLIWLGLEIWGLRRWKNSQCPGMKSRTYQTESSKKYQLKIWHRSIS